MSGDATRALFLCDGAPTPLAWRSAHWDQQEPITFRSGGGDTLALYNLSHALLGRIEGHAADLIRIASYVYAADQSVSRGGSRDVYGRAWRRHMALAVPVSDPDFWNQPSVLSRLEAVLSFASDAQWDFRFSLQRPEDRQLHLALNDTELLQQPDSVLLFSGGADSLCAAVEAVTTDGRRPVLLSHASNPARGARQANLVHELRRRVPAWPFPQISAEIHRRGREARDRTQRTRPFLFGSLGAAVAGELGVATVLLADNGVVSINPPINDQLIGATASRSTHPKFIGLFNSLIREIFPTPPKVTNPLWSRTRSEALGILKDSGLPALFSMTISCAYTRNRSQERPHCGLCSQCIDRRFASIGAGLEEYDPRDRYGHDIFRDELPDGIGRMLAVSFHRWALRAANMVDETFFEEYPQLYDAILPYDPTSHRTAVALTSMLRRHAQNTLDVLALEVTRASDELVQLRLPPSCLLRLVLDDGANRSEPSA